MNTTVSYILRFSAFHPVLLHKLDSHIRKKLSGKGTFRNSISLPRKIKKFTVLRSPHIDKKSREQFELRVLNRQYAYTPYNSDFNCLAQIKKLIYAGVGFSIKREMTVVF